MKEYGGNKMTSQEMLQAWIKGKTYQEIGDICGISRQAVYLRIKTLSEGKNEQDSL